MHFILEHTYVSVCTFIASTVCVVYKFIYCTVYIFMYIYIYAIQEYIIETCLYK